MKLPCEIVVWYVIPVVKSELARAMVKRGMTQKRVSEVIGVTQAAISQYMSKKRGSGMELTDEMRQVLNEFADSVVDGKSGGKDIKEFICRECKIATDAGIIEGFCCEHGLK
jgi:uncharacterized protein